MISGITAKSYRIIPERDLLSLKNYVIFIAVFCLAKFHTRYVPKGLRFFTNIVVK